MYSTPPQGNYNIGSLCESLLDVLDIALVVFDTGGELVHFNRHAQHVLSQGASIQVVDGQLQGRLEDRSALLALARDCAGAADRDGPSKCLRIPREDRQPLILSMTGIRLEQEGVRWHSPSVCCTTRNTAPCSSRWNWPRATA